MARFRAGPAGSARNTASSPLVRCRGNLPTTRRAACARFREAGPVGGDDERAEADEPDEDPGRHAEAHERPVDDGAFAGAREDHAQAARTSRTRP